MAKPTNHDRVTKAMGHLRIALIQLKLAGSSKTVNKVRKALKSADGARRHAKLEPYRTRRKSNANIGASNPITPGSGNDGPL